MRAVIVVANRVIEEENAKQFGDQYRKLEPGNPYRELELLEGFEEGKSNIIF